MVDNNTTDVQMGGDRDSLLLAEFMGGNSIVPLAVETSLSRQTSRNTTPVICNDDEVLLVSQPPLNSSVVASPIYLSQTSPQVGASSLASYALDNSFRVAVGASQGLATLESHVLDEMEGANTRFSTYAGNVDVKLQEADNKLGEIDAKLSSADAVFASHQQQIDAKLSSADAVLKETNRGFTNVMISALGDVEGRVADALAKQQQLAREQQLEIIKQNQLLDTQAVRDRQSLKLSLEVTRQRDEQLVAQAQQNQLLAAQFESLKNEMITLRAAQPITQSAQPITQSYHSSSISDTLPDNPSIGLSRVEATAPASDSLNTLKEAEQQLRQIFVEEPNGRIVSKMVNPTSTLYTLGPNGELVPAPVTNPHEASKFRSSKSSSSVLGQGAALKTPHEALGDHAWHSNAILCDPRTGLPYASSIPCQPLVSSIGMQGPTLGQGAGVTNPHEALGLQTSFRGDPRLHTSFLGDPRSILGQTAVTPVLGPSVDPPQKSPVLGPRTSSPLEPIFKFQTGASCVLKNELAVSPNQLHAYNKIIEYYRALGLDEATLSRQSFVVRDAEVQESEFGNRKFYAVCPASLVVSFREPPIVWAPEELLNHTDLARLSKGLRSGNRLSLSGFAGGDLSRIIEDLGPEDSISNSGVLSPSVFNAKLKQDRQAATSLGPQTSFNESRLLKEGITEEVIRRLGLKNRAGTVVLGGNSGENEWDASNLAFRNHIRRGVSIPLELSNSKLFRKNGASGLVTDGIQTGNLQGVDLTGLPQLPSPDDITGHFGDGATVPRAKHFAGSEDISAVLPSSCHHLCYDRHIAHRLRSIGTTTAAHLQAMLPDQSLRASDKERYSNLLSAYSQCHQLVQFCQSYTSSSGGLGGVGLTIPFSSKNKNETHDTVNPAGTHRAYDESINPTQDDALKAGFKKIEDFTAWNSRRRDCRDDVIDKSAQGFVNICSILVRTIRDMTLSYGSVSFESLLTESFRTDSIEKLGANRPSITCTLRDSSPSKHEQFIQGRFERISYLMKYGFTNNSVDSLYGAAGNSGECLNAWKIVKNGNYLGQGVLNYISAIEIEIEKAIRFSYRKAVHFIQESRLPKKLTNSSSGHVNELVLLSWADNWLSVNNRLLSIGYIAEPIYHNDRRWQACTSILPPRTLLSFGRAVHDANPGEDDVMSRVEITLLVGYLMSAASMGESVLGDRFHISSDSTGNVVAAVPGFEESQEVKAKRKPVVTPALKSGTDDIPSTLNTMNNSDSEEKEKEPTGKRKNKRQKKKEAFKKLSDEAEAKSDDENALKRTDPASAATAKNSKSEVLLCGGKHHTMAHRCCDLIQALANFCGKSVGSKLFLPKLDTCSFCKNKHWIVTLPEGTKASDGSVVSVCPDYFQKYLKAAKQFLKSEESRKSAEWWDKENNKCNATISIGKLGSAVRGMPSTAYRAMLNAWTVERKELQESMRPLLPIFKAVGPAAEKAVLQMGSIAEKWLKANTTVWDLNTLYKPYGAKPKSSTPDGTAKMLYADYDLGYSCIPVSEYEPVKFISSLSDYFALQAYDYGDFDICPVATPVITDKVAPALVTLELESGALVSSIASPVSLEIVPWVAPCSSSLVPTCLVVSIPRELYSSSDHWLLYAYAGATRAYNHSIRGGDNQSPCERMYKYFNTRKCVFPVNASEVGHSIFEHVFSGRDAKIGVRQNDIEDDIGPDDSTSNVGVNVFETPDPRLWMRVKARVAERTGSLMKRYLGSPDDDVKTPSTFIQGKLACLRDYFVTPFYDTVRGDITPTRSGSSLTSFTFSPSPIVPTTLEEKFEDECKIRGARPAAQASSDSRVRIHRHRRGLTCIKRWAQNRALIQLVQAVCLLLLFCLCICDTFQKQIHKIVKIMLFFGCAITLFFSQQHYVELLSPSCHDTLNSYESFRFYDYYYRASELPCRKLHAPGCRVDFDMLSNLVSFELVTETGGIVATALTLLDSGCHVGRSLYGMNLVSEHFLAKHGLMKLVKVLNGITESVRVGTDLCKPLERPVRFIWLDPLFRGFTYALELSKTGHIANYLVRTPSSSGIPERVVSGASVKRGIFCQVVDWLHPSDSLIVGYSTMVDIGVSYACPRDYIELSKTNPPLLVPRASRSNTNPSYKAAEDAGSEVESECELDFNTMFSDEESVCSVDDALDAFADSGDDDIFKDLEDAEIPNFNLAGDADCVSDSEIIDLDLFKIVEDGTSSLPEIKVPVVEDDGFKLVGDKSRVSTSSVPTSSRAAPPSPVSSVPTKPKVAPSVTAVPKRNIIPDASKPVSTAKPVSPTTKATIESKLGFKSQFSSTPVKASAVPKASYLGALGFAGGLLSDNVPGAGATDVTGSVVTPRLDSIREDVAESSSPDTVVSSLNPDADPFVPASSGVIGSEFQSVNSSIPSFTIPSGLAFGDGTTCEYRRLEDAILDSDNLFRNLSQLDANNTQPFASPVAPIHSSEEDMVFYKSINGSLCRFLAPEAVAAGDNVDSHYSYRSVSDAESNAEVKGKLVFDYQEAEKKVRDFEIIQGFRNSPEYAQVGDAVASRNLEYLVEAIVLLLDLMTRVLLGRSLHDFLLQEEYGQRALLCMDMAKGYSQFVLSPRLYRYGGWVFKGTSDAVSKIWTPLRLFLGLSWAPAFFQSYVDCWFGGIRCPRINPAYVGHICSGGGGVYTSSFSPTDPAKTGPASAATESCDAHSNSSVDAVSSIPVSTGSSFNVASSSSATGVPASDPDWTSRHNVFGSFNSCADALRSRECDLVSPDEIDAERTDVDKEAQIKQFFVPDDTRLSWFPVFFPYLDDLNTVFKSILEALIVFVLILALGASSGFNFGIHKTDIQYKVACLGQVVDVAAAKMRMDAKKFSGIASFPFPITVKMLIKFLCVVAYCRCFYGNFLRDRASLAYFVSNFKEFNKSNPVAVEAFNRLKSGAAQHVEMGVLDVSGAVNWKKTNQLPRFGADGSIDGARVIGLQSPKPGKEIPLDLILHRMRSFSDEEKAHVGNSSLRMESLAQLFFVREILPTIPPGMPFALVFDSSNVGEEDIAAICSKPTVARSVVSRLTEVNEALSAQGAIRIKVPRDSNVLADPSGDAGVAIAANGPRSIEDWRHRINELLHTNSFNHVSSIPRFNSIDYSCHLEPIDECAGLDSLNLSSFVECGVLQCHDTYCNNYAAIAARAPTALTFPAFENTRCMVQIKEGLKYPTRQYCAAFVATTSKTVLGIQPVFGSGEEFKAGIAMEVINPGPACTIGIKVAVRNLRDQIVSVPAVVRVVPKDTEAVVPFNCFRSEYNAQRDSYEDSFLDKCPDLASTVVHDAKLNFEPSKSSTGEVTRSDFSSLYAMDFQSLDFSDPDAVEKEMDERRDAIKYKRSDKEHQNFIVDCLLRLQLLPPSLRILFAALGSLFHQALWSSGRILPCVRGIRAFHPIITGYQFPKYRPIALKGLAATVIAFHLWEHAKELLLDQYDQSRWGLPIFLSAIFLAPRSRSVLGRIVVDAVLLNRAFTDFGWRSVNVAEVWEGLLESAQLLSVLAADSPLEDCFVKQRFGAIRDSTPVDASPSPSVHGVDGSECFCCKTDFTDVSEVIANNPFRSIDSLLALDDTAELYCPVADDIDARKVLIPACKIKVGKWNPPSRYVLPFTLDSTTIPNSTVTHLHVRVGRREIARKDGAVAENLELQLTPSVFLNHRSGESAAPTNQTQWRIDASSGAQLKEVFDQLRLVMTTLIGCEAEYPALVDTKGHPPVNHFRALKLLPSSFENFKNIERKSFWTKNINLITSGMFLYSSDISQCVPCQHAKLVREEDGWVDFTCACAPKLPKGSSMYIPLWKKSQQGMSTRDRVVIPRRAAPKVIAVLPGSAIPSKANSSSSSKPSSKADPKAKAKGKAVSAKAVSKAVAEGAPKANSKAVPEIKEDPFVVDIPNIQIPAGELPVVSSPVDKELVKSCMTSLAALLDDIVFTDVNFMIDVSDDADLLASLRSFEDAVQPSHRRVQLTHAVVLDLSRIADKGRFALPARVTHLLAYNTTSKHIELVNVLQLEIDGGDAFVKSGKISGFNVVVYLIRKAALDVSITLDSSFKSQIIEEQKKEYLQIIGILDKADKISALKALRSKKDERGKLDMKALRRDAADSEQYSIHQGLLFYRRRVVMPSVLLMDYLFTLHLKYHFQSSALAYQFCDEGFYVPWRILVNTCKEVVSRCLICLALKCDLPFCEGSLKIEKLLERPGETLYIDWVTNLNKVEYGDMTFTSIYTACDGASLYPFWYPSDSASASNSARFTILVLACCPYRVIRCDNGSHFLLEFKELLKSGYLSAFGSLDDFPTIVHGSNYSARAQHAVEAPHKELNFAVRIQVIREMLLSLGLGEAVTVENGFVKYLSSDGVASSVDWLSPLPGAMRRYILLPRAAYEGYSVSEMHCGRKLFKPSIVVEEPPVDLQTCVTNMFLTSEKAIQSRQISRLLNQEKKQRELNGLRPIQFTAGDIVLRKRIDTSKYLSPYYVIPFVVTSLTRSSCFVLRLDGKSIAFKQPARNFLYKKIPMSRSACIAYLLATGVSELDASLLLDTSNVRFSYISDDDYRRHDTLASDLVAPAYSTFPSKSTNGAISFNTNGFMRWCRQLLLDDTLRAFFCSSAATVVLALQETKLTAKTLNSALQLARFLFPRYRPYFNNCMEKNGYSGTAVLVRIDVPHGLPREIRSGEGRTMMVELHVSGSSVAGSVDGSMKVSLINIYSMNVGKDLKRLEEALSWRSDIYALIEKVACDENVLLLGDLNALLSKTPKHCHVKFADQELPSTTQVECDHLIRTFPGNLVIQDPVHMTMLHSVKGFVLDYVAVTRNLTWKAQTLPRGVLYSCNATRDHLPLWGSLMKKDN